MNRKPSAFLFAVLAISAGACGDSTAPNPTIEPMITAGGAHTCSLSKSGTVSCWGNNDFGQLGDGSTTGSASPVLVASGTTFKSVSAGPSYTCALDLAGAAYCWGANYNGSLGNGTTANSAIPVQVSGNYVFASLTTGYAHVCGLNSAG